MTFDGVFTLLPPIITIIIAVWRRSAIGALAFGLWLTHALISNGNPFSGFIGSVNGVVESLSYQRNMQIIFFSLLIGGMIELMRSSGGISAFINWLNSRNLVKGKKSAGVIPTLTGSLIFTDTNLSMFCGGMASQTLFDKYKMGRARLAYLLDSTCSPVSMLVLINGWGAYVLSLLEAQSVQQPVSVLVDTLLFNFYCWLALILAWFTALSSRVYGPMAKDTGNIVDSTKTGFMTDPETNGKARYLAIPLLLLVSVALFLLWWTGNGDLRKGAGAFSVMWAVISAFIVLLLMVRADDSMKWREIISNALVGFRKLLPVVVVLVLSIAFGDAVTDFGTGLYVSELVSADFPGWAIAPAIFIAACVMSFTTGTSWGTFAVLIPIAIPISSATGLPPALLVSAVLSGGVFGDHASPISDSTIVASMASGCDHFEHVKTQLPYAVFTAVISLLLFTGVSFVYL